eukprot:874876-Amorphochlora_amoeboformis.AAC.1
MMTKGNERERERERKKEGKTEEATQWESDKALDRLLHPSGSEEGEREVDISSVQHARNIFSPLWLRRRGRGEEGKGGRERVRS